MDDAIPYPSIHCSQDQVTVGCGSKTNKQKNLINYWHTEKVSRMKNAYGTRAQTDHFPAYECTIYSSAQPKKCQAPGFEIYH